MQTPMILPGLAGGVLIGIAVVLLMATLGRVTGISGIIGSLLPPKPEPDRGWRLTFLLGLILGPLLVMVVRGDSGIGQVTNNLPLTLVAGLLVGLGTSLGSGCTSGHGVCGLSRWSMRSLVATLTFIAMGMVTVAIARHLL